MGTWIVTSWWSYEHWQDVLDHGCSPTDRLSRYAAEFDTVELNASFYRSRHLITVGRDTPS